jgi:hypothetical protein
MVRGGLANSARVFTQTKTGRVALLGGSITENPGWRDSICAYLERPFPETRFEFIAAGIASTGSTPGAFRLVRDVLSKGKVDLLFEEAEVNVPFTGNAIGICVAAGRDAGIVEYTVDGGPVRRQNLFTPWSAWLHLPWYYVLESSLPQGDHILNLRIAAERDPRSTGHACRIIHVLVN